MKNRQTGIAAIADALAAAFSLFPGTDYRISYPHKSAARRMDEAWVRTGKGMQQAMTEVARKHGIAR